MNQRTVYHVLAACLNQRDLAENVERMNYWKQHYNCIRRLFVRAGWID